MIAKYRKKPVVIEAAKLTENNLHQLAAWCKGEPYRLYNTNNPWKKRGVIGLDIETLEGTMLAEFGDYIIKGVKGEFYPCKPDVFDMTYEAVK